MAGRLLHDGLRGGGLAALGGVQLATACATARTRGEARRVRPRGRAGRQRDPRAELGPYEAYPQVLEARLRAEGRRIEVMNVGLWGWSTRQERIAYGGSCAAIAPTRCCSRCA